MSRAQSVEGPPTLTQFLQVPDLACILLRACDPESLATLRSTSRIALAAVRGHCASASWRTKHKDVRRPERLTDLAKYPALSKLKLGSLNGVSDKAVSAVVRAAGPKLASLDLSENKLGPSEVAALVAVAPLSLGELELQGNQLGDEGVVELLRAVPQRSPTSLSAVVPRDPPRGSQVSQAGHGQPASHGVAASPVLPGSLEGPNCGAARTLASQLTLLNLNGNLLGDEAMAALAGAGLSKLGVLHLGGNQLRPTAAAELARGEFPALRELYIDGNRVGHMGMAWLARMNLSRLQKLDVRWNHLGPLGARYLAQARMPSLQVLHAEGNHFGAEGAAALACGERGWPSMEVLHLGGNDVADAGAAALAKGAACGAFPMLRQLHLRSNDVTALGAAALATAGFPSLQRLDLCWNQLGGTGKAELFKAGWASEEWRGSEYSDVFSHVTRG